MKPAPTRNPVFDPTNADSTGKMQQNATFCNEPPPLALDSSQINAIELILQGLGDAQVAQILKINHSTLWRWKNQNPDFQEFLLAARGQLHTSAMDAYQNNLLSATKVMSKFLDDRVKRNRLRAATIVLQMAGSMRPPLHR